MLKVLFDHSTLLNNTFNFRVRQERSLTTYERTGSRPEKQHISVPEKFLCSHLVQYHSTISTTCDLERQTGRQV